MHTNIESREFEGWFMAYAIATKIQIDQLKQANWMENKDKKSQGKLLLREFWKANSSK